MATSQDSYSAAQTIALELAETIALSLSSRAVGLGLSSWDFTLIRCDRPNLIRVQTDAYEDATDPPRGYRRTLIRVQLTDAHRSTLMRVQPTDPHKGTDVTL
ncbi:hypothetical protein PCANC_28031 [Puccinia coronata f. sp. avenae]|uniref:Uncharacterized protein n=1 Tax=Puccinia coronata f. sp. avenae TaxID=200324 RepID=A0A2N5TIA1_9BASI|nr:hypothetical protein PCANC_28031 [Puccinia coronata f. sp. avenae]